MDVVPSYIFMTIMILFVTIMIPYYHTTVCVQFLVWLRLFTFLFSQCTCTSTFNSCRPSAVYTRQHRFRLWIVAYSAPSHYLNQSRNIVNWTIGNKRHGNFNRNSYISIHENAFETVVCEMADILSRPRSFNYRNNEFTPGSHNCLLWIRFV